MATPKLMRLNEILALVKPEPSESDLLALPMVAELMKKIGGQPRQIVLWKDENNQWEAVTPFGELIILAIKKLGWGEVHCLICTSREERDAWIEIEDPYESFITKTTFRERCKLTEELRAKA